MTQSPASSLKFVFFALGIFVSYFVYGLLQEKITKTKYGPDKETFRFTASMVLIQCVVNAAFAYAVPMVTGALSGSGGRRSEGTAPRYLFAAASFTYITAMWASNASLQFVAYPTQVLGKSCKPIPVMLLGLLFGKRYSAVKYLMVLLIVTGVSLFLMKDKQGATIDSEHGFGFGEALLLLSLLCDGLTGLVQDRIRMRHPVSSFTMMFNMNCWSTLYLLAVSLSTGELAKFVSFAVQHHALLWNILLFSLCSAVGQLFIFATVVGFGPLNCSLVTTTRKFFTILASVLLFRHPLSSRQWLGTGLVFAGLFGEALLKPGGAKRPVAMATTTTETPVVNGVGDSEDKKAR